MAHKFAGNPLDRADYLSRDERWLAQQVKAVTARFLPMRQLNVLLTAASSPTLGWLTRTDINWQAIDSLPVFLGLAEEVPCFALDVSYQKIPEEALRIAKGWWFADCLQVASAMSTDQAGILAHARAKLHWHEKHRFCANCGQPTRPVQGGRQRECMSCDTQHFPRTDPVVIMLATTGDRCLLGQPHGPLVRMGIWSALAGFVEQGESIEEAVCREVFEEAGIRTSSISYHSSQPWPFPSSLMIGCYVQAMTTDIKIDQVEMHDVRWFSKDQAHAALSGNSDDFKLPGPVAIAHHLIADWVAG